MCIRNQIAEMVLFGEDNQIPDETPVEEVERNLDDMVSTLDDATIAVRKWEDFRLASLLDLLTSHTKNIKAKVGIIKEHLQTPLVAELAKQG